MEKNCNCRFIIVLKAWKLRINWRHRIWIVETTIANRDETGRPFGGRLPLADVFY
jgi:hypothetical protein